MKGLEVPFIAFHPKTQAHLFALIEIFKTYVAVEAELRYISIDVKSRRVTILREELSIDKRTKM